ncbi:MAG: RIP metalloprotease RseP [Succinivibrio sp.]
MLNAAWDLFFFAVALGVLVTVHEAGHFFAARACGVTVQRFSIGFGKVLFKHTGRDGCEYAVSAIPLGGYVKMLGENKDESGSGSFRSKSLPRRAAIIAAGPACNIVLAFVLYCAVNLIGFQAPRPIIGDVIPGSEAAQAGMEPGSAIVSIDGEGVGIWGDASLAAFQAAGTGRSLEVRTEQWEGRGKAGVYSIRVPAADPSSQSDPMELAGLRRYQGDIPNKVSQVQPGSPAEGAGIMSGDVIAAVNGSPTPTWYRVLDAIRANGAAPLDMTVERGGRLYDCKLTPRMAYSKAQRKEVPLAGIAVMADAQSYRATFRDLSYPLGSAVAKGLRDTVRMSHMVISAAVKMLSGAISADSVSGPIAIAKGAGESAAVGAVFFLSFLAAISVNLGILNLLPIPVLDGGQLLFMAYEAVAGRAPSQRVQYALTVFGFSILLALMMLAVFNDIRGL